MTQVAELCKVVSHLSAPDRTELAAFLLGTLDETHYWVDDDEASRRREELNSELVKGLSLQEFKEACGRSRPIAITRISPPHSPPPLPVLTVPGAAGAKAIS